MEIKTTNTILYCKKWRETVTFYHKVIGLTPKTESSWMIEFVLTPTSCLSVADAKRTSIRPASGAGITLTFQVPDLTDTWRTLTERDIQVDPIRDCRMGGQAFFLRDPEGNRLEFWSDATPWTSHRNN